MKFLQSENPPEKIVVMIQKEVAQRICSSPPKMNKLAIFCQFYAEPKIIDIVPPSAFWPKPKVDSAILQLTLREQSFKNPIFKSSQNRILTNLINTGFSHPRKTLLNNLFKKTEGPSFCWGSSPVSSREKIIKWLKENNINPMQRPETLSCIERIHESFQCGGEVGEAALEILRVGQD